MPHYGSGVLLTLAGREASSVRARVFAIKTLNQSLIEVRRFIAGQSWRVVIVPLPAAPVDYVFRLEPVENPWISMSKPGPPASTSSPSVPTIAIRSMASSPTPLPAAPARSIALTSVPV